MTADILLYAYGSRREICFTFVLSSIVDFRRFRFRFRDFLVKIWLAKALFLRSLPVAVLLKRFNAPLLVFILGMMRFSYFGTMSIDISLTSILGAASTRPTSSIFAAISSRRLMPRSVWDRSLPLNIT